MGQYDEARDIKPLNSNESSLSMAATFLSHWKKLIYPYLVVFTPVLLEVTVMVLPEAVVLKKLKR